MSEVAASPVSVDSRDWRATENVRAALAGLCAGRDRFPTLQEFTAAGLAGLYLTLEGNDTLGQWAREFGLELPAARRTARRASRSTARPARNRKWTDARTAEALAELCADRSQFPSQREFAKAGYSGLFAAMLRDGTLDVWAQRMGLERPGAREGALWTEDAIEAKLSELCAGKVLFPSVTEFKRAGAYGLYSHLLKAGRLDEWAERLGVERRTVSTARADTPAVVSVGGGDLASRLEQLIGTDLHRLSRRQTGQLDDELRAKSWAQAAVRRALGRAAENLPIRTVPVRASDGQLTAVSTMPLAQIDPEALPRTPFPGSELEASLADVLIIARDEDQGPCPASRVLAAVRFRLIDHPELAARVAADYAALTAHLVACGELSSGIGELIQARTKGLGGTSKRTFAFYARPALIELLLAAGQTAVPTVNEDAAQARAISAQRPSREQLRSRLAAFLASRQDRAGFPTVQEFCAAGKELLYWQLRATDELPVWAAEFGLAHRGNRQTVWSGPRIEAELARMLAGRAVFPSRGDFEALGRDGLRLHKRVEMYGGKDFWARWMGVLPRRPTDSDIEQALGRFLAGREIWPTVAEFKLAGLGLLHSQLSRDGKIPHWQERFGLDAQLWTDARIERTLRELSDRLGGRMPTMAQMRQHVQGLSSAVQESGGSARWAAKLGLEANSGGRVRRSSPVAAA